MGFRNPFRIQVDDNDVAYVTDYSPDSNVPENFRGPAGTGRVEVVRKASNYGWPLCYSPKLPYYRWNFNTSTPLDPTPRRTSAATPTAGRRTARAGTPARRSTRRASPAAINVPPVTQPDLWYSYRDNANPPLGTPCLAYYDGSGRQLPAAVPRAVHDRRRPARRGAVPLRRDTTRARRSSRRTTTAPSSSASSTWTRCARSASTRTTRSSRSTGSWTAARRCSKTSPFPFECDNPMDMQFGTDGNYYLLTYGDGFFQANPDAGMYRWEYVKGQRAPQAVHERHADQRHRAAERPVLQRRLARSRPG